MANIIKSESVNTNHGWGFGGWVGNINYYDNGTIIEQGRNHHRHTGTSKHFYMYLQHNDCSYIVKNRQGFCIEVPETVYLYQFQDTFKALNYKINDEEFILIKEIKIK